MRADALETPERKEFLRMLELQTRLGKGSDAIRRLFVQWVFDEAKASAGGRLRHMLRCERCKLPGCAGKLDFVTGECERCRRVGKLAEYPAGEAYADVLLFVHHYGFDIEAVLEGLEALLHRWSTDIAAVLPIASDISAAKTFAVRSAGTKPTL